MIGGTDLRGQQRLDSAADLNLTAVNRIVRGIYSFLAWCFLACIIIQVFLAGLATFVNPADWAIHKTFVKFFAVVPLVLFLLSFAGRIRGWKRWISLGLFALVEFQFMTIEVFSSIRVITALHPVIALLLFWGSILTVRKTIVTSGRR